MPKLIEGFLHLEGGENMLDKHRRLDCPGGDVEGILGFDEDVVPQPRLEVVLNLGKVEIDPRVVRHAAPGVVKEIQPKIKETRRR